MIFSAEWDRLALIVDRIECTSLARKEFYLSAKVTGSGRLQRFAAEIDRTIFRSTIAAPPCAIFSGSATWIVLCRPFAQLSKEGGGEEIDSIRWEYYRLTGVVVDEEQTLLNGQAYLHI